MVVTRVVQDIQTTLQFSMAPNSSQSQIPQRYKYESRAEQQIYCAHQCSTFYHAMRVKSVITDAHNNLITYFAKEKTSS